jgi:hypothetical protein
MLENRATKSAICVNGLIKTRLEKGRAAKALGSSSLHDAVYDIF